MAFSNSLTKSLCIRNGCGQVAVANVLSSFSYKYTEEDLLRMNPAGIFTSPLSLVRFLSTRTGAVQHNSGSIHDLCMRLDRHIPIIAMVNSGTEPHWLVITAYKAAPSGETVQLEIHDQLLCGKSGCKTISVPDFMKMWESPLAGLGWIFKKGSSYKNVWIEASGGNSITAVTATAPEDFFAGAINEFVYSWKNSSPVQALIQAIAISISIPVLFLSVSGNLCLNAGKFLQGRYRNLMKGRHSGFLSIAMLTAGKLLLKVANPTAIFLQRLFFKFY